MNTNSNLPRVGRGRYQLLEELGQGGFGKIYRAKDIQQGTYCAIKQFISNKIDDLLLLQKAIELFEREAEVLARLTNLGKNQQIPKYIDCFEEDGELYLVQELIKGQTLAEILESGKKFSEDEIIEFLKEILPIVSDLHNEELIHRDIKPDNLIKQDKDKDKYILIDFGSVKLVDNKPVSAEERIVTNIGTEGYAPPEQREGRPVFSSDIYAVGMTAIKMLTGLEPSALTKDRDKDGLLLWKDEVIKKLNPNLKDILNKMVHDNYADRYLSVEDVLEEIEKLEEINLANEPIIQNSNRIDLKSLLSRISGRRRLAAGLALVVTPIVMAVVSWDSIKSFQFANLSPETQPSSTSPSPITETPNLPKQDEIPERQVAKVTFTCEMTDWGVPVTTVTELGKQPKQLIRWFRALGSVSVEERCKQVSVRLDNAYKTGQHYITHGSINRQPVICATDKQGNGCQNLLWNLHWQEDNPQFVLDDFLRLSEPNYSGIPLRQSSCPIYIDINAFIRGEKQFAEVVCNAN